MSCYNRKKWSRRGKRRGSRPEEKGAKKRKKRGSCSAVTRPGGSTPGNVPRVLLSGETSAWRCATKAATSGMNEAFGSDPK